MDPSTYLQSLAGGLSETPTGQRQAIERARDAVDSRLWSELGEYLLDAVAYDQVRAAIHDIHKYVLIAVRSNISPFVYAKMLLVVIETPLESTSPYLEDTNGNMTNYLLQLLDGAYAGLVGDDVPSRQGKHSIRCLRALALMTDEAKVEARQIISDASDFAAKTQAHELDPTVSAILSKARLREHELLRHFADYYKDSFAVHGYCVKANISIPASELSVLAYKTAVAALLSETTYNFGQLLTFEPYTNCLRGSDEDSWLLEWTQVCNDGNVVGFEEFVSSQRDTKIATIPDLADAMPHLNRKVRLMALLHLAFHTPVEQRVFSFEQIGRRCQLAEDDIEPLLLTAIASELIKGNLDGLNGIIHISWVQPRVLNANEIRDLANMIKSWKKKVSEARVEVEHLAVNIPS